MNETNHVMMVIDSELLLVFFFFFFYKIQHRFMIKKSQ